MTAEEFKTMCNKNKKIKLTVDDLSDPNNKWGAISIMLYNQQGRCNALPLWDDIDEWPECSLDGLVDQQKTILAAILKEESYQRLINSGAFQV